MNLHEYQSCGCVMNFHECPQLPYPKLSFTSTNNAGRLEICYCPSNGGNCTWTTISAGSFTTSWSWKNVQIACRDLNNNADEFSDQKNHLLSLIYHVILI